MSLSCVRLFETPRTVAHPAPRSMGLPRQEYWSGLPFPSSGDLPDPGIKTRSPTLTGRIFTTKQPGKPVCDGWMHVHMYIYMCMYAILKKKSDMT